jgi:enoyl-CoA hydratase/carnithine racemase
VKTDYPSIGVELNGQVATITINHPKKAGGHMHWDLGEVFSDLRGEDSIRVIVLTGQHEGIFSVGPTTAEYDANVLDDSTGTPTPMNDPHRNWHTFTGLIRCHEAMAAIEKPIIAKVNGENIAFGSSIMFSCDLIYAREDARIADNHLGMGEVEPYGPRWGMVPGDGGTAMAPLYFSPPLAKEYLMLGREFTGAELAAMHLINAAVPASDLDATVDQVVARLLRRPAYALAWTKRVVNRMMVEQMNRTLDAGAAYEMVTFLQIERNGWKERFEL